MLLAGGIDRGSGSLERGQCQSLWQWQWQWHLLVAYRWRFNIFAKFHTSLYIKKKRENKADFNLGPARGSLASVTPQGITGGVALTYHTFVFCTLLAWPATPIDALYEMHTKILYKL